MLGQLPVHSQHAAAMISSATFNPHTQDETRMHIMIYMETGETQARICKTKSSDQTTELDRKISDNKAAVISILLACHFSGKPVPRRRFSHHTKQNESHMQDNYLKLGP